VIFAVSVPEALRALSVEGPGTASLDGVQRMRALQALYLERVRDPDLRLLADLPALRSLDIERPTGSVPWRALERLTGVTLLRIDVPDADAAAEVATLNFGALERLEGVTLMTSAGRDRCVLGAAARVAHVPRDAGVLCARRRGAATV
jgi:hypothetical protein